MKKKKQTNINYKIKQTQTQTQVFYKCKSFCPEIEEYVGYYGNLPFSFGLDPCKTGYSKFQSAWKGFKRDDATNVNVTIKVKY